MASGYTESGSVYFGFSFDPTLEEFVLYPSGGLIPNQLGVYSGIYAGEKTAGAPTVGSPGNIGNAGNGGYDNYYAQVWTGITGALVAKNISGFIVTEYEPRILLDVYAGQHEKPLGAHRVGNGPQSDGRRRRDTDESSRLRDVLKLQSVDRIGDARGDVTEAN